MDMQSAIENRCFIKNDLIPIFVDPEIKVFHVSLNSADVLCFEGDDALNNFQDCQQTLLSKFS